MTNSNLVKKRIAIELIAFLLVLLFIYASFNKMLDFEKFRIQIGQSPLLTAFQDVVPLLVVSSEIAASICLALPRLRLIGFFAAFSLMVMFTAYILAILNFSTYIPCSCGGVLEKLGWTEHLVFNMIFTLLALAGIFLQAKVNAAQRLFGQPAK